MAGIDKDHLLDALQGRDRLFALLKLRLDWPLDPEDPFAYDEPKSVAGRAAASVSLSRLVDFSANDPFVLFLVEFKTDFLRGHLREILRGVRRRIREEAAYRTADMDELVFVCTLPSDDGHGYGGVRFVHFEEREGRQPKLRVFGYDRDSVDETFTLRTVNLPALKLTHNLLDEVDWASCKKNWKDAWNVEKVTREFFKDYKRVFETVRDNYIHGVTGDKQLFTQRLFNRLMFIHFLSKKRWLRFGDRTDYLFALSDAAKANSENLYRDRLYLAFFNGLGVLSTTTSDVHNSEEMQAAILARGVVPYLNGGLFEMVDDDDGKHDVTIDNAAFDLIFSQLFRCYNFTISESTPDDQDVAVDPEMLGKVFEELVTGRHESGSYYTPRPIVAFMCREALKGYLAGCGGGIERLVDFHDAKDVENPEAVLDALKRVRVVDPACGSGAYLLGMLQELIAIRQSLFATKRIDAGSLYDRKLEIIQNSLYGVDIDPFAVNTARLRLWLSLVVDDSRNALEPDPKTGKLPQVALPNLDFKIEQGDSVTSPDPSRMPTQGNWRMELIRQFDAKKRDYANVRYVGDKSGLKKEIDALRADIAAETPGSGTAFDWRVDFGEVFAPREPVADIGGAFNFGGTLTAPSEPGGFDIVLANPPYVRGELIKDIKPALKRVYGDRFGGTMDLYCFFYFRAIELLKDGGQLVFITPNKWFRAGYGLKLRAEIARTCRVRSITDFGELPVFATAATFPMIFVAEKGTVNSSNTLFTQVKSLNLPYPDIRRVIETSGFALPLDAIQTADWRLAESSVSVRNRQMERGGISLGEYVDGRIYRGILTGFNAAFIVDSTKRRELIEIDPRSAELIKPLSVGNDIRRWRVENQGETRKYLIVTGVGVPILEYPAIFQHLLNWEAELNNRVDKGNHWWELRACAYYDAFDGAKIIYPEIAKEPRFAFDPGGLYCNAKCFVIAMNDLYLLAVLNSKVAWSYAASVCSVLGDHEQGGRLMLQWAFLKQLPIPKASENVRSEIVALAKRCLDRHGSDVSQIEAEINEHVTALYGL